MPKIDKNKVFVFISTYCWWLLRFFLKRTPRCKKCIVSEKFSKLNNGICALCSGLRKEVSSVELGQEVVSKNTLRLKELFGCIKVISKYHALLMLSGGKDSAYILNRVKEEHPSLKILCLFVNNGFSSPYALANAIHITEMLQTDLVVSNSHVNQFRVKFREEFLELQGRGSAGVIDFADGNMIFDIGMETAQQLNIPFVIGGLSWVQINQILNLNDFVDNNSNTPSIVYPLAAWHTNENDIRAYVKNKKLMLPGSDNPIVSNNELIMPMCAIDILNNGFCSFEAEFAQMIREGKSKRKSWLYNFELLEFLANNGLLNADINHTLKKLNLELADVTGHKLKGRI